MDRDKIMLLIEMLRELNHDVDKSDRGLVRNELLKELGIEKYKN